jgi:hypothetical protein
VFSSVDLATALAKRKKLINDNNMIFCYFHSHIFVTCSLSLLLTFTWVMNKASILLRKASFPPVVEEELTVLKNINPLYVITPLSSDRPILFAIQVAISPFSVVITPFPTP